MTTQLFRTAYKQRLVAGGADEVIGGMPIPASGVLKNVWGDVHIVAASNVDRDIAIVYAVQGYIIPNEDDTVKNYDTLWDQMVPKDVSISNAAGSIDADLTPETVDGSPVEEPGEVNVNRIWNVGNFAQRIWNREKILTIASRGLFEPVASSEVDLWMPTDHFKVRIKENYKVDQMSYVLFALGIPAMDAVTTTNESTLVKEREVILNNMDWAVQLAMPDILGLTETGATSVYSDLANMIENLVEPVTEEETPGAFIGPVMNVFTRFTYEVQTGPPTTSGPIAG